MLGHELTHRLQELAPEEYNAFRDIVAADDATAKKTAYAKELYASRGIELDDAGALDEVTADYAGALMENTQVLEEFIRRHRENRSLLEKLLDAIRGIIAKLTGAEKRQAQTAEGKLAAALERGTNMDRKPVNVINSLYGLEHPAEWIKNQIDSGSEFVLYDEKRANAFLQTYGYSASVGDGIRSLGESISQEGGPVNPTSGPDIRSSLKDPAGFNEDMAPQPEQSQNAALAYDIQRMRRIGATLGENGARALAAVYDETLAAQYAPEQVAESFIQIYNATLNGRRLSEAAARKAAELPDYIRLAAEDSAQRDLARAGQTAGVESPGTIDGTTAPGYNTLTETEVGVADKSGQTAAWPGRAAAELIRSDAAQGGGDRPKGLSRHHQ